MLNNNQVKSRNRSLRLTYALLIIIVIALGILSRKIPQIPPITGDVLYAVMMFLIIRFFSIRLNDKIAALLSLSICYGIELSQLYQAPWINQIRNTTLGGLVLGHGFLWSDMVAYTAGSAICLLVLRFFSR